MSDATLLLALTSDQEALWWVALGLGLVVILVVVALLTLLYRFVVTVDEGVAEAWAAAKRLAANTTTVWQLTATKSNVEKLHDEALLHDEVLGRSTS